MTNFALHAATREPYPDTHRVLQPSQFAEQPHAGDWGSAVKAASPNFPDGHGTEAFYNLMAPLYKLLYSDWETSLTRQGQALHRIIQEFFGLGAWRVLDAACGIGTQSIGLAQLGYSVSGSDIAAGAIAEARAEAAKRGLEADFRVADMRALWEAYHREFDVVIACDNAVPHLPSEAAILEAFQQFYRCTTPTGGCLVSVRDYSGIDTAGRNFHPRVTHSSDGANTIVFDLWDFEENGYEMSTYFVRDQDGVVTDAQIVRGARYHCIQIATLESLLRLAGFQTVATLNNRFFQPLIVALKGTDGNRPNSTGLTES